MDKSVFSFKEYLLLGGPADGSWVRLAIPPPSYYLHTEHPPISVAEMEEDAAATKGLVSDTYVYAPVTLRDEGAEYTVFVHEISTSRVIERLIYGYPQPK